MVNKPYSFWFDTAKTVRRHSDKLFMDGVEREAALAAVSAQAKGQEAAIDAIEKTFYRFENICPKWDGSIA